MNRVTAGEPIAFTYDVGAGGADHTARVTDARGHHLRATTSVASNDVTVNVSADEWRDGQGGYGRLEIIDAAKAVVKRDRFRILPGLVATQYGYSDYGVWR